MKIGHLLGLTIGEFMKLDRTSFKSPRARKNVALIQNYLSEIDEEFPEPEPEKAVSIAAINSETFKKPTSSTSAIAKEVRKEVIKEEVAKDEASTETSVISKPTGYKKKKNKNIKEKNNG